MTPLEIARQRVQRSRFIPLYLVALLLAYGCTITREARSVAQEKSTPTRQIK